MATPVRTLRSLLLVALVLAVTLVSVAPLSALPAPSKTAADQGVADRDADLASVRTVIAQPEVAEALAAQGLTPDEVNQRLAELSPEELRSLSTQIDQVQSAGVVVPMWAWIVIVVALVVLIVAVA